MVVSFNCSVLSDTFNILETFSVNIIKENNENTIAKLSSGNHYDINDFKVDHLKEYICYRKNVAESDRHAVKLWKVDIDIDEVSIRKELFKDENKMKPHKLFLRYFETNETGRKNYNPEKPYIIAIIPTSTETVNWNNIDSIYNWIKELKRPSDIQKSMLVSSFGAKFPLQGRDETLKMLLNGDKIGSRNGIFQRLGFSKNRKHDKQDHHIPILANGPGTGKSRFLQELPTLIENHAREYIDKDNKELLDVFNNRKMLSINVTFNGNTGALEKDTSAGPASVALRILYEHFLSGGTMSYNHFFSMCNKCNKNWHELTISNALEIVIKDAGGDINFVTLGIDELNCLHSLAKGDLNPVQEIVRAVGVLSCSEGDIFYAPILAGTIQGPLEDMITASTYDLLRLPLRLLSDNEMGNISLHMIRVRTKLEDYINKLNNSRTFNCCISDVGGQVRALEIFYKILLSLIDMDTHKVDYKFVMQLVRHRLQKKYPFKKISVIMKPVVSCAILNIPVNENDEFETDDGKRLSYIDLSSEGIINLEMIPDNPGMSYVRMPYIWVWILTSIKDFKAGQFWDVMIDQESHVLWQDFEDFNMRFWVLRLQLLKELLHGKVKLRDLFRGAYHVNGISLWDDEFQLPDVKEYYIVLKSRFPDEIPENLFSGTVYKNGVGAPWDLFFILGNCLFAIQIKSSDAKAKQPQTLTMDMVDDKYQKVKEAFNKVQRTCKHINRWVLLICINGQKTKNSLDSLKENCFIINYENFKDFYGYTFSSRAEFAAANDQLDANTAENFELKTIRDIGDTTANKICEEREKRPFCDENDLYDRVGGIPVQAKKKIKVVKSLIETSTIMNID